MKRIFCFELTFQTQSFLNLLNILFLAHFKLSWTNRQQTDLLSESVYLQWILLCVLWAQRLTVIREVNHDERHRSRHCSHQHGLDHLQTWPVHVSKKHKKWRVFSSDSICDQTLSLNIVRTFNERFYIEFFYVPKFLCVQINILHLHVEFLKAPSWVLFCFNCTCCLYSHFCPHKNKSHWLYCLNTIRSQMMSYFLNFTENKTQINLKTQKHKAEKLGGILGPMFFSVYVFNYKWAVFLTANNLHIWVNCQNKLYSVTSPWHVTAFLFFFDLTKGQS